MQETWVQSLIWEDSPEEGNGNPLQYSCLENPHGQRSLTGYSPWGHKESDTTERLTFTFKVFSRAAVSLCIPISNIWEFQLLYILTNIYFSFLFIIAKLAGVKYYLIMVLVCISLVISHVECHFISLVIRISEEKFLLKSLVHFWVGLHVFCAFLSFRSFLYVLDYNHLSDIWFTNISDIL